MQGLLKKVKGNQYIFSKKLEKLKTDNCIGLIRLTSQEKTTFGLQYKKEAVRVYLTATYITIIVGI